MFTGCCSCVAAQLAALFHLFQSQERKANLSKKLRYLTKATAMVSMLRKGVDEDRLSVKTRRRSSVKNSGRCCAMRYRRIPCVGSIARLSADKLRFRMRFLILERRVH